MEKYLVILLFAKISTVWGVHFNKYKGGLVKSDIKNISKPVISLLLLE